MNAESLISFIKNHRGKVVGITLGVVFGALVWHIGFWFSVFLVLCATVGLYFGSKHDKGEKLAAFFDNIMTKRTK